MVKPVYLVQRSSPLFVSWLVRVFGRYGLSFGGSGRGFVRVGMAERSAVASWRGEGRLELRADWGDWTFIDAPDGEYGEEGEGEYAAVGGDPFAIGW